MARIINQWMLVGNNLDLERIKCVQRRDGIIARTGNGFQSTRKSSKVCHKEEIDKVLTNQVNSNTNINCFVYLNTFEELSPSQVKEKMFFNLWESGKIKFI
jgi:hypothetical protein